MFSSPAAGWIAEQLARNSVRQSVPPDRKEEDVARKRKRKYSRGVRRPCHGRHGQAIEFAGYTMQMLRDTLENWQSEFLQLDMVHVVRLPE